MQALRAIPTHVDYAGQARAEQMYKYTIGLFGGVGLVWGWLVQQLSQSVTVLGAGVLLAALLAVPPWPMYRRKPLAWQPRAADQDADARAPPPPKQRHR